MLRTRDTRKRQQRSPFPEARVVQGRHAPAWSRQVFKPAAAIPGATTYERDTSGAYSVASVLYGFWPVLAILSMGIAMIWSASVFNGP